MKVRKICFVVSSPLTVHAFLRNHMIDLAKVYDVSVVANMEGNQSYFQGLPLQEIIHLDLYRNIRPKDDLIAIHQLTKIFQDRKFDAVHSVTPKAGLIGMIAAKRAGIKNRVHIFTGQVWATKKGIFRKILIEVDKFIARTATQLLVDGRSQRNFLIENKIITPDNSRVLGQGSISGVNEHRFVPSEIVRNRIRKELKFSNDDVVFGFLGRLNSDKGIKELALAFGQLMKEHLNAKLLLIGYDEGNMVDAIRDIVEQKGVVLFYGPTDQPEEVLQAADVFCLPSHREGFGTSVLEASLLGLPVICSDAYGLKETIIDDVTGLRHKVNDVESLYSAMHTLYINKDQRGEMGVAGRNYVLDNFRAEQVTKEWLRFYADLFTH